jgi:PPOX class probable F420-dependent enzyme
MRVSSAFDAAAQTGTAPDFSGFEGNQYAVLVTFRKDGTPVPTPVWFALLGDRRLVIGTDRRTAKVRRIGRDPRARVFPSDPRGKPLGPAVEGTARIVKAAGERQEAEEALDRSTGGPGRSTSECSRIRRTCSTWRSCPLRERLHSARPAGAGR